MGKFSSGCALLLLAFVAVVPGAAGAPSSFTLLQSLYNPSTAPQSGVGQGYGLAVDGNLAVVGTPLDDSLVNDSGSASIYDLTTGARLHVLTNPTPAFDEQFGLSVGISGTRVVVGAPNDGAGAPRSGVVCVYDLAGATPTVPILVLTNPIPTTNGNFGWAVAISGTRVVVGMDPDNYGFGDTCKVYVYDLAGATPALPILTLTDASPASFELFGAAVAIEGTRVVVGSIYDNPAGVNRGVAFVYDLASAAPATPSLTLTNPGPSGASSFGAAVAISGTRVVVGAHGNDSSGYLPGEAHVFDLANATPTVPIASLIHPSPVGYGNFGRAVAIDGSRVLVGAANWAGNVAYAGIAYLYDVAGATPTVPILTLNNPSPASTDLFGARVGVSGTRVVITTPGDDAQATDAGASYVYDVAGPTPTEPVFTLDAPRPATGERFGSVLAASGSRVVVGFPQVKGGPSEVGRAYIYDSASATPDQPMLTLANPAPVAGDQFGGAVGMSGTRVLIGAYGNDAGANNAGSAYLYDLAGAQPDVPVLTLTNPTPAASDNFGDAVAISGTRAVVGAQYDDTGAPDAGVAYVYDFAGAIPAVPILTLTNPTPAGYEYFSQAVAIDGTRVVIGAYWDRSVAPGSGSAYVYDLAGATPAVPVLTLTNPTPASYQGFGYSVGISGERVVVGMLGSLNEDTSPKRAYVYDLAGGTPAVPILTLTNPVATLNDGFGYSVAIDGTRVVVAAHFDDVGAPNSGSVYVFDVTSLTPAVPIAALRNPSPAANDSFGSAVAVAGLTVIAGTPGDDTPTRDRGAIYIFGVGPQLALAPSAPGQATLSWSPAPFPGFVLQYTESLSSTNWLNAPSGAMNPVTVPTTGAGRFYRVAQP